MKLGPLEVRRATLAAAQPTPKKRPDLEEHGASGTQNLDGFVSTHEYNTDLQHPRSIAVYRRMIRSDPDVQEARNHIRKPILNAAADIQPASDDPLDVEVAAFVGSAFFDWPAQPEGDEWPFGSFSEYVSVCLRYLDWGFSLMELPLKLVEDELEWQTPAGEKRSTRRQWYTWAKFAERLPETIQKWNLDEGRLVSVEQWAWKDGSYETITIPASAFVLLCNDREGDDFYGVSVLRSAFKPYLIKETVEKIMGVAAERHGTGVNVAYIPNNLRADQAVVDRVEDMMRDLNGGDRPYLVFPGAKGEVTSQNNDGGFLFEIKTPESSSLPDLVKFCEYLRSAIKGNMLVRFAELGHGQTGARATGDTQSQVWYDALHAVARQITDVSQVAIRRLVDLNYTVARYPTLVFQDIESRNLEEFATAHAKLLLAQGLVPDATYRRFVREVLGAPDEDEPEELEQEQVEEETQPGEKPGAPVPPQPDEAGGEEPPEEDGPMMRAVELMTDALEALRAAAEREQPAPVVHVEPTPVTVEVPAQEPPVVHVAAPEVTIEFPPELVQTLELLREFTAREPTPAVFAEAPTVTVELPAVAEAIQALAARLDDQPAPTIHVDMPQTTVEIPELRDLLLALADRPDPVAPVVTVDLAGLEEKLELTLATVTDAVTALAGREVPAPVVNLDLSDLTEAIRELAQPSAAPGHDAQHQARDETVRLLAQLTETVAGLATREQAPPVVQVEPLDLDALKTIAETLAAQPERAPVELQIGEGGTVNVDPGAGEIAERLERLALALENQPAPVVNQAAPVVNIDLSPLVNVLQQLADKELPAPVVNVPSPEPAESKTKVVEIRRDETGRASGAIVKEL